MDKLYYPVRPFVVVQPFGANAAYYLKQFGTNGHMGIDLQASHGMPVYAAHDGVATFITDSHGGEGIHLAAPGFMTIYWHLVGDTDAAFPNPITAVKTVTEGDLIGYADNTGAPFESSGTHLHFGLLPLDANSGKLYPTNGFDGCVDPMPHFCGIYAEDVQKQISGLRSRIQALKDFLSALISSKK